MKRVTKLTALLTAVALAASMAIPVSAALGDKASTRLKNKAAASRVSTATAPKTLRMVGTRTGALGSKANQTMPGGGYSYFNSVNQTGTSGSAKVYSSYNGRVRLTVSNLSVDKGTTISDLEGSLYSSVKAYDTVAKKNLSGEFKFVAFSGYKINNDQQIEFAFTPETVYDSDGREVTLPVTKGYITLYVDGVGGNVTLRYPDGEYISGGVGRKLSTLRGSLAAAVLAENDEGDVLDGTYSFTGFSSNYELTERDNGTAFVFKFVPKNSRYETVSGRIKVQW